MMERLEEVRVNGTLDFLRPDGKGQISVRYEEDRPVRVEAVVLSAHHSEEVPIEKVREGLMDEVIRKVIPAELYDPATAKTHINPTGRFVEGGPKADTGLTGRKIIVDTYGGMAPHGGGSFSGKDPTKVDRSGTYAARWIAKNVVAAGLARRCLIQVAYAIGVEEPVSVAVETYGTGTIPDAEIQKRIEGVFDLRPRAIIEDLNLLAPIYERTAYYGHFGRNPEEVDGHVCFTWERTERIEALKG